MNTPEDSSRVVASVTSLKCCPFCACPGEVVQTDDQRFGVRCKSCHASVPSVFTNVEVAILWWGLRQGGVSYRGGLATKGIISRKKRKSCRRNLKKARQQKKLLQILAKGAALATQLQVARREEIAEMEAEAAKSRDRLRALEKVVAGDPVLVKLYDVLARRDAARPLAGGPCGSRDGIISDLGGDRSA